MPVISVADLTKAYPGRKAVNGISFEVRKGETFALLGPNGAGKTTTIEILEGYRTADSGTVKVLGLDPQADRMELKQRTGLVLQTTALEPELTVAETLAAFARLYARPESQEKVLASVNLAHITRTRVGNLSGGQKRRLEIALGIIGSPELLFLDEPTTGFDPTARRRAWDLIASLRGHGTTILLTTHYMEEAQALADRVAVVASGRNVAEGTPSELIANEMAGLIRFTLPDGIVLDELPLPGASAEGSMAVLQTVDPVRDLSVLTAWALDRGVVLPDLTVVRPTLEDVYLRLTGAVGVDV